jgi:hypothetical protein
LFFDVTDGLSDKDICEVIQSVLGDNIHSGFEHLSGVLALTTVKAL